MSGADNRGNKACLALGIANTVTDFQHSQSPTEQARWSKQVHGQEAPTANRQCWQPDATANTLTHTGLRDDKRASLALHLWVGGPPEAGDRQVFPLYVLVKLARVASRSQGRQHSSWNEVTSQDCGWKPDGNRTGWKPVHLNTGLQNLRPCAQPTGAHKHMSKHRPALPDGELTWRNVDRSLGLPAGRISRGGCPPSKALRFQPLEPESRIPLSLSHLFLLYFFFSCLSPYFKIGTSSRKECDLLHFMAELEQKT